MSLDNCLQGYELDEHLEGTINDAMASIDIELDRYRCSTSIQFD